MDHWHEEMIIPIIIKMEVKIDSGGWYWGQCTSFTAFRLSSVNGFELPAAHGDLINGVIEPKKEGYRVDQQPAIGCDCLSTRGQSTVT